MKVYGNLSYTEVIISQESKKAGIYETEVWDKFRSHYPEKASALDFKTLRFGDSDVVFDLFIETIFLHLITLLSSFLKLV